MAMLTLNGAALPEPSALSVELQDALLSARRTLSGAASVSRALSTPLTLGPRMSVPQPTPSPPARCPQPAPSLGVLIRTVDRRSDG